MSTSTPPTAPRTPPQARIAAGIPRDRLYRLSQPFVSAVQALGLEHHGLRLLHGLVHATCRRTATWHDPWGEPPEEGRLECQDLRRRLGLESPDNRVLAPGLEALAGTGLFDVLEFRNDRHWLAWRLTEDAHCRLFAWPEDGYGYVDIADVATLRTTMDFLLHDQLGVSRAKTCPSVIINLPSGTTWEAQRRAVVRALQRSAALYGAGFVVLLECRGSRIGIDTAVVRMRLPHTRWNTKTIAGGAPSTRRCAACCSSMPAGSRIFPRPSIRRRCRPSSPGAPRQPHERGRRGRSGGEAPPPGRAAVPAALRTGIAPLLPSPARGVTKGGWRRPSRPGMGQGARSARQARFGHRSAVPAVRFEFGMPAPPNRQATAPGPGGWQGGQGRPFAGRPCPGSERRVVEPPFQVGLERHLDQFRDDPVPVALRAVEPVDLREVLAPVDGDKGELGEQGVGEREARDTSHVERPQEHHRDVELRPVAVGVRRAVRRGPQVLPPDRPHLLGEARRRQSAGVDLLEEAGVGRGAKRLRPDAASGGAVRRPFLAGPEPGAVCGIKALGDDAPDADDAAGAGALPFAVEGGGDGIEDVLDGAELGVRAGRERMLVEQDEMAVAAVVDVVEGHDVRSFWGCLAVRLWTQQGSGIVSERTENRRALLFRRRRFS